MKNEDRYKTPAEREAAYYRFCTEQKTCDKCPLHVNLHSRCAFAWLYAEYKGPDLPFKVMTDVACIRVVDAKTGDIVCDAVSIPQAEVVCERMNAAAMDWHKRMVEKEAE